MKNLSLVSFVGVDSLTKFEEIKNFSKYNLKVKYEFGILYSISKNGIDKRYPDHNFSKKYLEWAKMNSVYSSLHLCGSSIDSYFEMNPSIIELADLADRIQLNLAIKKYTNYDMLADTILSVASRYNHNIILQNNKSKEQFNKILLSRNQSVSLSLLNDSSGGFGREIKITSPPHEKYFTGYAGGINPNNVLNIINIIKTVNVKDKKYYIDMESGIRVDNNFSIEKCDTIAQLIENND